MNYKIVLKQEADDDLSKLSHSQKILIYKQFEKLKTSPQLGIALGKKAEYDLTGYKKMYVDKKQLRIVYRIIDDIIEVEVIAVGKRDGIEVYKKASKRV
ncbi:MAG: addiction module toxin RelE [Campylobacterota bacterium]|nr:addiction module toxin RelE [Campylobacterota bacterium]